MRGALAVLVALALAGCSSGPPSAPQPSGPPVAAAAPMPAVTPAARPAVLASRDPSRDPCGADALQSLVGRSRTEIPVPIEPDRQRVACTTCPAAQEVRPDRLNFLFDADTGLIRQIRCG